MPPLTPLMLSLMPSLPPILMPHYAIIAFAAAPPFHFAAIAASSAKPPFAAFRFSLDIRPHCHFRRFAATPASLPLIAGFAATTMPMPDLFAG
jgi:hypothetical protein